MSTYILYDRKGKMKSQRIIRSYKHTYLFHFWTCHVRNVNIIDMTTGDPNLDMTQVILPELPNMRVEKHETEPDI